jgi:hypothetical protein
MKWLITSVILGAINTTVMAAFAASQLGPTPVMLPLFLCVLSFVLVCVSAFLAVCQRKRRRSLWFLNLISGFLWIGMILLNFKHFADIMYVT